MEGHVFGCGFLNQPAQSINKQIWSINNALLGENFAQQWKIKKRIDA